MFYTEWFISVPKWQKRHTLEWDKYSAHMLFPLQSSFIHTEIHFIQFSLNVINRVEFSSHNTFRLHTTKPVYLLDGFAFIFTIWNELVVDKTTWKTDIIPNFYFLLFQSEIGKAVLFSFCTLRKFSLCVCVCVWTCTVFRYFESWKQFNWKYSLLISQLHSDCSCEQ